VTLTNPPAVKYVALLAFNRIVVTHPVLVAQQEDVILGCIDSEDVTIRIKALDLVQGMVSSENLVSIVSRLMRQLKASSSAVTASRQNGDSELEQDLSSDEDGNVVQRPSTSQERDLSLPDDYTIDVIGRILKMCSQNNYSSMVDFDWYIDVLTQLVRIAPAPRQQEMDVDMSAVAWKANAADISEKIGDEIRNVAVKVKAVRFPAIRAAESTIHQLALESSSTHPVVCGALKPISWLVGEYASQLSKPDDSLGYLLQLIPRIRDAELLAAALQAVVKILALIAGDEQAIWTSERKSRTSLLMARVIHVLEPLTSHPYLEVQERAVEFIELLRLAAEAASGQAAATDEVHQDPPLLLTQAIPSLFSGWELNSIAFGAQKNVPMPADLDLDQPIHPNLDRLLAEAESIMLPTEGDDEFETYYKEKPAPTSIMNEPAINRLGTPGPEDISGSYQRAAEDSYLDPDIVARRKAERLEKNRDDPFYIQEGGGLARASTPIHNILQRENGPDLDIDSIPIMQLDLGKLSEGLGGGAAAKPAARPRSRQKVMVAKDENLGNSGTSTPRNYESENNSDSIKSRAAKFKQSLLKVDSSHLSSLSLDPSHASSKGDFEQQKREEAEMVQAVKEVERLRLEMQRAKERIQVAQGIPDEGTVLKKKKPKKPKAEDVDQDGAVKVKKKKKKPAVVEDADASGTPGSAAEVVTKPKKKKVKKITALDEPAESSPAGSNL
jgi:AP-3 complex subunit delta-1